MDNIQLLRVIIALLITELFWAFYRLLWPCHHSLVIARKLASIGWLDADIVDLIVLDWHICYLLNILIDICSHILAHIHALILVVTHVLIHLIICIECYKIWILIRILVWIEIRIIHVLVVLHILVCSPYHILDSLRLLALSYTTSWRYHTIHIHWLIDTITYLSKG